MEAVEPLTKKIDELAELMQEFGLDDAKMSGEGWSVAFSREVPVPVVTGAPVASTGNAASEPKPRPTKVAPAAPKGTPISSPMMGVFYSSPSPGSPPFVKEGDTVTAGQVVGLIEAMKVFNEITTTVAGTVTKVSASNGALVQPGEPLLFVG